MYAIIEESGGQRKVIEGQEIVVDLLSNGDAPIANGAKVTFDRVLVVGNEGGTAKIGQPYVAGAVVTAEVIEPVTMGVKVHIQRHREKKTFKKKTGHRQRYTTLKVTGIKG